MGNGCLLASHDSQVSKPCPSSMGHFSGTQEGLDVGGALGEGRAVDLCQTAKRSAGYHWLRHPCSPLTKTKGPKIEAATATVTAPVG